MKTRISALPTLICFEALILRHEMWKFANIGRKEQNEQHDEKKFCFDNVDYSAVCSPRDRVHRGRLQ